MQFLSSKEQKLIYMALKVNQCRELCARRGHTEKLVGNRVDFKPGVSVAAQLQPTVNPLTLH